MKMFYRKALMKAGFDKNSKMYKDIDRIFDWEKKKLKREREQRRREGITFVPVFSMEDDDGNLMDLPSPENFIEEIEHKADIELLRKSLKQIPEDDAQMLLRIYGSERGEMTKISKETGIPLSTLHKHIRFLLDLLKQIMENGGEFPWDDPDFSDDEKGE